MKLICDCGNEMEFVIVEEFGDDDINAPNDVEEKGYYCTKSPSTFSLWSEHDEAGITCDKCKKNIWIFT